MRHDFTDALLAFATACTTSIYAVANALRLLRNAESNPDTRATRGTRRRRTRGGARGAASHKARAARRAGRSEVSRLSMRARDGDARGRHGKEPCRA
jgi:hypothetical protein